MNSQGAEQGYYSEKGVMPGAEGGIRTLTPLREADFKSLARGVLLFPTVCVRGSRHTTLVVYVRTSPWQFVGVGCQFGCQKPDTTPYLD